jgi:hypothetical protein
MVREKRRKPWEIGDPLNQGNRLSDNQFQTRQRKKHDLWWIAIPPEEIENITWSRSHLGDTYRYALVWSKDEKLGFVKGQYVKVEDPLSYEGEKIPFLIE